MADIVTRLPGSLRPDAARTVLRPFIVEDPSTSDSPRTQRVIDRILALNDAQLRDQLHLLVAGLESFGIVHRPERDHLVVFVDRAATRIFRCFRDPKPAFGVPVEPEV